MVVKYGLGEAYIQAFRVWIRIFVEIVLDQLPDDQVLYPLLRLKLISCIQVSGVLVVLVNAESGIIHQIFDGGVVVGVVAGSGEVLLQRTAYAVGCQLCAVMTSSS